MKAFDQNNERLRGQFDRIHWIESSGLSPEALEEKLNILMENRENLPRCILKAKGFELILLEGRLALDEDDIFQEKVYGIQKGAGFLARRRRLWESEIREQYLKEETQRMKLALDCKAYHAASDFGHTSPNTRLLLEVGFPGLLERIRRASAREGLSAKQKDFYASCRICLESILAYLRRLAKECETRLPESAAVLKNLAKGKPNTFYEALQLLLTYFFLHENIFGTRVRTLGRLDLMLAPFYKKDLEEKRFTEEELQDQLRFFLNKIFAAKVPFDLPLCLGGLDENGNEVTNEFSDLFVDVYNGMNIYSPKIHVRVSEKTPADFVKKVLACIRGGNSSFVFLRDETVIPSLESVGIPRKDALQYVPIGCYEPAVWGKEIGCTGNGGVNLAKAVEFAFTGGKDLATGAQISRETAPAATFEEFLCTVKAHLAEMTDHCLSHITQIETYYGLIGPDPILSSMYDHSVERGVDVMEGGALYNNSSLYFYFFASLIDSLCAVKKLVFEEKTVSMERLGEILKHNWEGEEALRLRAKSLAEKYGNGNPLADSLTEEFSRYLADLVNEKPNGRGGVFKAALFCIDRFVSYGEKTMPTPDGRLAGEVLSKNLCASVGMDRKGVTALIRSATRIDHSRFPNGTVLDVVLHPSAVKDEDGLNAFYALLKTYFTLGGMALHGNVFSAQTLKKAQENPEAYRNLQVRVCGWNAYFVNLSRPEQDCFIKQAEGSFV